MDAHNGHTLRAFAIISPIFLPACEGIVARDIFLSGDEVAQQMYVPLHFASLARLPEGMYYNH